ncbi:MAG: helix-turn-helix domain-containing protein [Paracoccaceae bacterium]
MQNRLKDLRKERHLTQRQVAERAGLSLSYYTEIELGKKQLNQRRLNALADALNVSPVDILSPDDRPDHQKLVMLFEQMTENKRHILLQVAEEFASSSKTS